MIDYKRNASPNILLGDSRTVKIDADRLFALTGDKYSNLSYGGGSVPEIVTTFWYAAKITHLRNVYIGLNFNLYNSLNNMNRASEAEEIINEPLLYFCKNIVLKACCYNLYEEITNKKLDLEKPPMSKEAFWKYQLETITPSFYRRYKYPENYFNQLKGISHYCRQNNINLVFIIHPTHLDLQKKVSEFNLSDQEAQFKNDIAGLLFPIFDFDYPNEVTKNKQCFEDPYHGIDSVTRLIEKEVWKSETRLANRHL
jgi:hypothetical protein